MHRFYCPNLPAPTSVPPLSDTADRPTAQLDPDEAHHARRVLRLEIGEAVELFDGHGGRAVGELRSWSGGAVVALRGVTRSPRVAPWLDVAAAIPKGPRADEMVNQLSQLGTDRLIPLRAQRAVVDPRQAKLEKFGRAAIESAKQCGRAYLMEVAPPSDLAALLRDAHDVKLVAAPAGGAVANLDARLRAAQRVLVLIGPEGGWTDEELASAKAAGAEPWSLGSNILRIETAACAAASVIRYLTKS